MTSEKQANSRPMHLGKDGLPRVCRAKVRCPFGGAGMHFDTMEKAMAVSDNINEQLANFVKNRKFGIAVNSGYKYPTKQTERAIVYMNNLKHNIKHLETIYDKAREDIKNTLLENDLKNLNTEEGKLTYVKGSTRKQVDREILEAQGIANDYLKEVNVKEHTQLQVEENFYEQNKGKFKRFSQQVSDYNGRTVDLAITKSEDGTVNISEDTVKAIKLLKEFKTTIDNAKVIKQVAEERLTQLMKEAEVNEIKVGNVKMELHGESVRQIIDTKKLRDDNIYDSVVREVQAKDSVRIAFT